MKRSLIARAMLGIAMIVGVLATSPARADHGLMITYSIMGASSAAGTAGPPGHAVAKFTRGNESDQTFTFQGVVNGMPIKDCNGHGSIETGFTLDCGYVISGTKVEVPFTFPGSVEVQDVVWTASSSTGAPGPRMQARMVAWG